MSTYNVLSGNTLCGASSADNPKSAILDVFKEEIEESKEHFKFAKMVRVRMPKNIMRDPIPQFDFEVVNRNTGASTYWKIKGAK